MNTRLERTEFAYFVKITPASIVEGLHEDDKVLASGRIRRLQLDDMTNAGRGRSAVR
jgi:hypothetical protein